MKFFFIGYFLFNIGCKNTSDKTSVIIIENESSHNIDSLKITSYNVSIRHYNLTPFSKVIKEFSIDTHSNYEGAFFAKFFEKDSLVCAKSFGYSANSSAIKEKYIITLGKGLDFKEQ